MPKVAEPVRGRTRTGTQAVWLRGTRHECLCCTSGSLPGSREEAKIRSLQAGAGAGGQLCRKLFAE